MNLWKYNNLKLQNPEVHRFSSESNHQVFVIVIFIYGREDMRDREVNY
jgi:hypothetical protein